MMKSIHYQSDFKLIESGQDYTVPFVFRYYTSLKQDYVVSHIDGVYTNCRLLDDGRLQVVFDGHRLGCGMLACKRHFYLTDQDFHDGICNLFDDRRLGIALSCGKTDEGDVKVVLPPFYQQGKQGNALTWEEMTPEQKAELQMAVVDELDKEMVQSAPVSETEYDDFFNL